MIRLTGLAALFLSCALVGCATTESSNVSAGAVGSEGSCCAAAKECCDKNANMGAVGEGCSKTCGSKDAEKDASMGAVSGTKSECTAPKTCPMTGAAADPSMGAVSESSCGAAKKSGCCASSKKG